MKFSEATPASWRSDESRYWICIDEYSINEYNGPPIINLKVAGSGGWTYNLRPDFNCHSIEPTSFVIVDLQCALADVGEHDINAVQVAIRSVADLYYELGSTITLNQHYENDHLHVFLNEDTAYRRGQLGTYDEIQRKGKA